MFAERQLKQLCMDELDNSTVSIGGGQRFYIRTPHSALWNALPRALDNVMENKREERGLPRQVAFGPDECYVALWDKQEVSWGLPETYAELDKAIETVAPRFLTIALSPFDGSWAYVREDGSAAWHLDSATEDGRKHFAEWMEKCARTVQEENKKHKSECSKPRL
jgi:hypothetical protein